MGIFEKSIPRYVYNPVQRQVEPVQDYYVDDIFDPLFNRNVRNALTQKYGNPLLGTAMGYYEGIENALFGQDDKWGILGPGMGILSGFGRSMDKAGDVILGSLTETVKGATGQGFENPLENIFVEDEDYTGKRALASIANSMRGLAGGTTITEEDLDSSWNLPSLGIELATDPSILGGNLTKLAKTPSVVKQLGSADNMLGDVGKFLQQYDDVMAKASIDLTAPGLRPAIKALRNFYPKYVRKNVATNFHPYAKKINDLNLTEQADLNTAKSMQQEMLAAQELADISKIERDLTSIEELIPEEALDTKIVHDLGNVYDGGMRPYYNIGIPPSNMPSDAPIEIAPNLSDVEVSEAQAAHDAMKMPRKRLRKLVKDFMNLEKLDLDAEAKYARKFADDKTKSLVALNKAVSERDNAWGVAVEDFIDYAKTHGADVNILSDPYANDSVYNAYRSFVKTYLDLPEDAPIDLTDFADTLSDKDFEQYLRNMLATVLDEANPEYAHRVDLSEYAWKNATFSENEAVNKLVVNALEEKFPNFSKSPSGVTLSPSQMGKLSKGILASGNQYADTALMEVISKHVRRGTFPTFKNAKEFRAAFKKKDVADTFKILMPDKKAREDFVSKLERIYFPPKEIVGAYGKPIPYDQYRRYKDFEELHSLMRAKGKLNRMDDSIFGVSISDLNLSAGELAHYVHAPWELLKPERYLQNISVKRTLQWASNVDENLYPNAISEFTPDGIAEQYAKAFEYYTLGRGRKVTKRGLREQFGTVFDDKTLRILEEDVAQYRQMLDTIRHSIVANSMASESLFFKDLESALTDVDLKYLQPANLSLSESRYDVAENPLSLNAIVTDDEGNATSHLDLLKVGDEIGSGTAVPAKRNYDLSSPYYSPYAFDRNTLWTIRQIIEKNPQVFRNFKNLADATHILDEFVQTKTVDDLFEYASAVDDSGLVYDNSMFDTVGGLLNTFEKRVMPLAQDAVSKGGAPIPYTKRAAERFPELHRYTSDARYGQHFKEMLRSFTDDWGFKETPASDGKVYYTFAGTFHPERFDKKYWRMQTANYLLRQPKFEFDELRQTELFSDKDLFSKTEPNMLADDSAALSKHFTPKKMPKSQKFTIRATEKAGFITTVSPATAAELAYNPPTPASLAIKHAQEAWSPNYSDEMRARMQAAYEKYTKQTLDEPPTPSKSPKTPSPESEKGSRIWRWFDKIREAVAVRANNLGLTKDNAGNVVERATLRVKRNADIIQRGKDMGVSQSTVRDVMKLLTERDGDVLTGAEFFDEIRRTGVIQASFTDRNVANAAYLRLKHNVDVFNAAVKKSPKDADALTIVSRKMSNGNLELKVMFNTKNKKIAKQISKNVKGLRAANFADVTFLNARQLTTDELAFLASDDAKKVVEYLTEVNEMARDQARMLGFTFDEMAVHNKHVRNVDPITANYIANDIYNGIDLDSIDEIGVVLSNLDEFRQLDRGVFGAQLQGRRFRGAYWNYDTKDASLFTNDLEKIAKGSLGDGMFANSNYQSFVDFFVNDNFKIHGVFDDVEDIRKFLYAGGSEGLYAGNLKNIDLCVPKYDSNGRIIGIHRFDQYSDADLAKALANPDTILVPANTIDTLDKVIRKEIRLSNKAYAFLNKHFTIPFKFGVLTNPGFLVGNLNDAYLKQAVSMSEKYGTDVSAELAKVGEASAMYLNLGNSFNAAIDKWKKHMDEAGVELSGAETIPEILAGHGPSRKRLMEYLEGNLKDSKGNVITPILDDSEKGTIMLWTKLQQIQHTSNSLREFDDFAEAFGTSDYDVPRNIVDRILQGSGKYSGRKPSTWGAITNNPVSRAAMNASEFIENTMRGTAILNDLMHAGYSREQIIKILMSDDSVAEFAAAKRLFEVDYANAVNAMYEANFNYERMSDFMEGVGKAMPFPTFFLKNLTYWLELFSKNPQFFDHAITVQESMWQDRDVSNAEIEAEAKGRGAVPIEVPGGLDNASGQKLSKWFKGIFKPSPLQSMFGAFSLINDPVEDLSYRLHPAISGSAQAVNQALPHNPLTTFLGEAKYRPYSTDIYEKNVTQENEDFNSLEYALHKANPYERAVNTALRTPNKIAEGQAQLSDFLPSIFQPDFGKK